MSMHAGVIRLIFSALLLLLFVASGISGCGPIVATGPGDAFNAVALPTLTDDMELSGLREAIELQLPVLKANPSAIMQIGTRSISRGDYAQSLSLLSAMLATERPMADKLKYIGENFAFYEFLGSTKRGEILLTGYFEPVLQGSISHSTMFSRPLYGKPDDLLTISLGKFSERFKDERALKARVEQGRVVPYYTRKDIDGDKALSNRGLELVWIDPVDAFFLQIQGSGTVVTQKGSEMHLVYADKNGHRYEPVGKFLKDAILPKKVTMQNVERVLRQMTPKERDEILFLNPSYVFFKRSSKRAITALGVPATPGRTIAVDPRFAPKGALAFLQFEKPNFIPEGSNADEVAFIPASRFVVDQDSGGAITGTGRADLFCGRGDVAKREAGVLQNKARLLYLVPR